MIKEPSKPWRKVTFALVPVRSRGPLAGHAKVVLVLAWSLAGACPWVVGTLLAMGAVRHPWGCTVVAPDSLANAQLKAREWWPLNAPLYSQLLALPGAQVGLSEAPWLLFALVLAAASPASLAKQADLSVVLQCSTGEAFFYSLPLPECSPS